VTARGQLAGQARLVPGLPWLALLASLASLLASLLPAQSSFAYTADGMRAGQCWRLWTGHFVHYGSAHLWGDWLAFVVWAALVESESRRALLVTLLIGAPLLLLGLELVGPAIAEYRGLSGIDTALVIELILLRGFVRHEPRSACGVGPSLSRLFGRATLRLIGACSLALSALKIAYEFHAGHAILAHDLGDGIRLLPAAHALGALIGLGIGLALRGQTSLRITGSSHATLQ